MINPWLNYGWIDEEDAENFATADTLRPEDLEKLIEKNSKDPKDDGINCKLCKDWFYLAQSNEPDGTFLCRDCKARPWRNSPLHSE
jgi:hypothetical protein